MEPVRTLWLGRNIPAAQQACLASFLRVGHPVELFTYEAHLAVPPGVTLRDAAEILPRDRVFALGPAAGVNVGSLAGFSDVFRYQMLLRLGGYWVDTDVFCVRPLPDYPVVVATERTKRGATYATSCVLRCPPGHALARLCVQESSRLPTESIRFGQIGPELVAGVVAELGLEDALVDPLTFCPVNWFSYRKLLDPPGLAEQTCAVHLWNEMWRLSGEPIPWPGPRDSLLRQLFETLNGAFVQT